MRATAARQTELRDAIAERGMQCAWRRSARGRPSSCPARKASASASRVGTTLARELPESACAIRVDGGLERRAKIRSKIRAAARASCEETETGTESGRLSGLLIEWPTTEATPIEVHKLYGLPAGAYPGGLDGSAPSALAGRARLRGTRGELGLDPAAKGEHGLGSHRRGACASLPTRSSQPGEAPAFPPRALYPPSGPLPARGVPRGGGSQCG